jgi:hypothetical protein
MTINSLTTLLLSAFVIISFSSKAIQNNFNQIQKIDTIKNFQNNENDIIRISYNQKINGYEVNVIWKPKSVVDDIVKGPAILEFKSNEYEFTLTNNFFSLPLEMVDLVVFEGKIIKVNRNNISLDYLEGDFMENPSYLVNFLFVDLNFDGGKEILIEKFGEGQKWGTSYDLYSFDEYGLESNFNQITNDEPYNQIDSETKLDFINKKLILRYVEGICYDTYKTYSLNDNGEFVLTEIVQMERDDEAQKCYKLTYSVENGIETLISKVESNP